MAIGGIGQSALAKILLKEGFNVSGSDIEMSKYAKKLEDLGAKIYIGHRAENIIGNPVIVLSTAIDDLNPELQEAKIKGLKIIHRSDLLKFISEKYPCFIGFCGTHGKTTTSGMCAYLLSKANKTPAFAVGGIIPELNTNGDCEKKDTPYFVAELDESDGTILKYVPTVCVINNLEADHLDFYKNGFKDVLKVFSSFVQNIDKKNPIILNSDDVGCLELLKLLPSGQNVCTFAVYDKNAKYVAENICFDVLSSSFDFWIDGKIVSNVKLNLSGLHNVYNALATLCALCEAGFDILEFIPYFEGFSGMGRRFQKVANFNNIQIMDDYAHHPTEVTTTLRALENYKGRVVAVFQPHRYSRFQGLYNEFLEAFKLADYTIVLDVYGAGEKYTDGKLPWNFAQDLAGSKHIAGTIEEASKEILGELKSGDLVLTFGAGDITKMGGILNELHLSLN